MVSKRYKGVGAACNAVFDPDLERGCHPKVLMLPRWLNANAGRGGRNDLHDLLVAAMPIVPRQN